MHLRFTPEQIEFRREVREFISDRLPANVRHKMRRGQVPSRDETVAWHRTLNEKRWAAPHWPKQYGGLGLGVVEKIILRDELQAAPAPAPLIFNVEMLGPVILRFGSEEQKTQLLPKILNVDMWFCQGFSEPNAGSDLASLRTSAERHGDRYVVNGQKIWTSYGHYADWMFCLVRTSKTGRKQEGISMLLIDMKSPGITVRPIHSIDSAHHLNEVFFDNVEVPVQNLVGEEGQGWACATFLLGNERAMLAKIGLYRERLSYAREVLQNAQPTPSALRRMEEEMVLIEADVRALEMIQWRTVALDGNDPRAAAYASILKMKGAEITQRIAALILRAGGSAAQEVMVSPEGVLVDHWAMSGAPAYFYSRAATIYGGATEIQKEILSRGIF